MALLDDVPIILPNVASIDEVTLRKVLEAWKRAAWRELERRADQRVHVRLWEAHANIRVRDLGDVWTYILGPRP